jgi:hypothetical protein
MFGALELCPGSQGLLQLTSIRVLFSPHLLLHLDTASALAWFYSRSPFLSFLIICCFEGYLLMFMIIILHFN